MKNPNLYAARYLAKKFVDYFELPHVDVYYLPHLIGSDLGIYYGGTSPAVILIQARQEDLLGTLLHELTHHLADTGYTKEHQDSIHGYYFSLAKTRCITWAKKNVGKKLPYNIMLRSIK